MAKRKKSKDKTQTRTSDDGLDPTKLVAEDRKNPPGDFLEPEAVDEVSAAEVVDEAVPASAAVPGAAADELPSATEEVPAQAAVDGVAAMGEAVEDSFTEAAEFVEDQGTGIVGRVDGSVDGGVPESAEGQSGASVEPMVEGQSGASVEPMVEGQLDASAEPVADQQGEPQPEQQIDGEVTIEASRLESIIESLLFTSDKPLGLSDLKRLLGERDGKKISVAVQALVERRKGTGIEVTVLSSGWHLRTNPENANWVSKLLVGRPLRLSRAMLETLAIVAYRQPVTRPEVDDIRGVDCGPVLKNLLERGLVRIIGKKEEVGRPMLYGTTPEFLRIFNLRDLSELPTLREFYDLSAENQSRVDEEHGVQEAQTPSATTAKPDVALNLVPPGSIPPEPDDSDPLLDELDQASKLAKQALGEAAKGDGEESKDDAKEEAKDDAREKSDQASQGDDAARTAAARSESDLSATE
jgi:segregation and condensation protein B